MEVAHCGACDHIGPLHRAGRGACRINGCPCQRFAEEPVLEVVVEQAIEVEASRPPLLLWIGYSALVFVAGVLLGLQL